MFSPSGLASPERQQFQDEACRRPCRIVSFWQPLVLVAARGLWQVLLQVGVHLDGLRIDGLHLQLGPTRHSSGRDLALLEHLLPSTDDVLQVL